MAAGFAAGMARRDADEIIYIMGRFAQGLGCGRGGGVLFQVGIRVFVVFRRIFLLHAKKKQSHSAQVSATLKVYVYVWQFSTGEKPLFLVQIRAYNVVMYTKNTHTAMNPWWVTLERRNRTLHFTIRASTSTLEPIESPACASVALAPTRSEQWLQVQVVPWPRHRTERRPPYICQSGQIS